MLQVFVPVLMHVAAELVAIVAVPFKVTPTAPATVTVPAPRFSKEITVPVAKATDEFSGIVTAIALALLYVTMPP
jgi:hypothetical protein